MPLRPLVFGILFIGIFVAIIMSIIWVDHSHPIRDQNPLGSNSGQVSPDGSPSIQR